MSATDQPTPLLLAGSKALSPRPAAFVPSANGFAQVAALDGRGHSSS